jgi:hypothetical protein
MSVMSHQISDPMTGYDMNSAALANVQIGTDIGHCNTYGHRQSGLVQL